LLVFYRFRVTEQAINAIYLLGEHPDIICGDIIKRKATLVFDLKTLDDENYMEIDEESILTNQEPFLVHPLHLSQLVFIVGHVAIKQIVHLEVIEAEWKRRKAEAESKGILVLFIKDKKKKKKKFYDKYHVFFL
jgi:condensin complex subunit 1